MSSGNGLKSWEKDENDEGYRPHPSEQAETLNKSVQGRLSSFSDAELQGEIKRRKIAAQNEIDRKAKMEAYNLPIIKRQNELKREYDQLERKLRRE